MSRTYTDRMWPAYHMHSFCMEQGYVLSSVRRKLKAHLVGRPGAEIAALRKGGEVRSTRV